MMASADSSTPSAASAMPPATAITSALEPASTSCPRPGRPPGVASAARVRHLSFMRRSVPPGCALGHLPAPWSQGNRHHVLEVTALHDERGLAAGPELSDRLPELVRIADLVGAHLQEQIPRPQADRRRGAAAQNA